MGEFLDLGEGAELGNFWKSRMRVRQLKNIKNIFIYIFYILLSMLFHIIYAYTKFKSNLYITESWSVAFNAAALMLSHISIHVIIFFLSIFL